MYKNGVSILWLTTTSLVIAHGNCCSNVAYYDKNGCNFFCPKPDGLPVPEYVKAFIQSGNGSLVDNRDLDIKPDVYTGQAQEAEYSTQKTQVPSIKESIEKAGTDLKILLPSKTTRYKFHNQNSINTLLKVKAKCVSKTNIKQKKKN